MIGGETVTILAAPCMVLEMLLKHFALALVHSRIHCHITIDMLTAKLLSTFSKISKQNEKRENPA